MSGFAALLLRRRIGVWMAWVLVAYIGLQVALVVAGPLAFAARFGLPVGAEAVPFVHVYGVRMAFVGVCTGALLAQRRWSAVSTLAFAAVVMPLGDLALVAAAGAPAATLARHAVIAGVLVATGLLLRSERAVRSERDGVSAFGR